MQEIEISALEGKEVLEQLKIAIGGRLICEGGESTVYFDNGFGQGKISAITFDWGVSLINFDVTFNQALKIIFKLKRTSPVEFVFISEGSMQYASDDERPVPLEKYQNIIVSPKSFSKKKYIFPSRTLVKVNFITILKKEYFKKKNNNLTYLNEIMLSVFNDKDSLVSFNHLGNYNLKIADEIEQMKEMSEKGISRTLSLEGRLHLILAMQLVEHHNFENRVLLPQSISKEDIKIIHELSEYIVDNISDDLTISNLSSISALSPKKLQLGFKVLYSKSVNEYVRQHKLEIARDQLSNTELSISEIVYKIGFRSRSYFSKIFFEKYGLLPTEYRKKLKKTC